MFLSRYEIARIVGLRALQLETGAVPLIHLMDERLQRDFLYVAALELASQKLDVIVRRKDIEIHIRDAMFAPELYALLDTKDGGSRPPFAQSLSSSSLTSPGLTGDPL